VGGTVTRRHAAPEGVGPCVGSRRAGEILGVDERTVVRWADEGFLPVAYRTPGGHRRFEIRAVEETLAQLAPTEDQE